MQSMVKVTKAGGITIPAYFRKRENVFPGDVMELSVSGGVFTIKPYVNQCVFCGSHNNLLGVKGKYVCSKCRKEIVR